MFNLFRNQNLDVFGLKVKKFRVESMRFVVIFLLLYSLGIHSGTLRPIWPGQAKLRMYVPSKSLTVILFKISSLTLD